jgi:transposase-like protein
MKTIKIPDETFEFLAWLVRQDVTLPSVITDYLKWNKYSKKQIKAHFQTLNNACIKPREEKSDRKKKRPV